MNGFGNWFRQFRMRLSMGFRQFMVGRYGTDKLNSVILTAGLIVCLVLAAVAVYMMKKSDKKLKAEHAVSGK